MIACVTSHETGAQKAHTSPPLDSTVHPTIQSLLFRFPSASRQQAVYLSLCVCVSLADRDKRRICRYFGHVCPMRRCGSPSALLLVVREGGSLASSRSMGKVLWHALHEQERRDRGSGSRNKNPRP